jgi:hypothetical protein
MLPEVVDLGNVLFARADGRMGGNEAQFSHESHKWTRKMHQNVY